MRAPWRSYLPWGEKASTTAMVLVLFAAVGFAIAFTGELISSEVVLGVGGIVTIIAVSVGCVFIFVAVPFNAVRIWRTLTESWNRPPANQHKEWKP